LDADLKGLGFHARDVKTRAVVEIESPKMAVADHGPVADLARAERIAHVGAIVVQGKVLSADAKQGDFAIADRERSALPFGDLSH
ncbi:hypothetical protein SMA90_34095, partial [Escherichia coli]